MGREVRRVPADWQHPKNKDGNYKALFDGSFKEAMAEWEEELAQWKKGFVRILGEWKPKKGNIVSTTFEDWRGEKPRAEDYMTEFPPEKRTHYQMYETTTEGTPISPVMETPEKLARWLADNGASSFADMTATYEQWLRMITGPGSTCSAVVTPEKGMISGVEALEDAKEEK